MNQVALSTLAGGAVAERFEDALDEVIKNIQDVNTEPKVKRKITLEVTIAPDDKRDYGVVEVVVKTKLAALKSVGTAFHLGLKAGHGIAYENNPKQPGLFDGDESKKPNLVERKVMSTTTGIEWTDMTWNPVVGCTRVSAGCDHCYAIRQVHRMENNPNRKVQAANTGLTRNKAGREMLDWSGEVRCLPERLALPLKLKKPKRIFVNSLSDLFHEQVPDEFIDQVFAVMAEAQHSTFQILTKRPERMAVYFADDSLVDRITEAWIELAKDVAEEIDRSTWQIMLPLKNVWLGVSVEDQKTADERIPFLLQTPAAVRFLSCEPLLEPINLSSLDGRGGYRYNCLCLGPPFGHAEIYTHIAWVIAGGESGPRARPIHPSWVRSIRDQCQAAGVPFFFKQWGEWLTEAGIGSSGPPHVKIKPAWIREDGQVCEDILPHSPDAPGRHFWIKCARVGKKAAGRLLDGRAWNEMPHH